jgi:hypothetical protein
MFYNEKSHDLGSSPVVLRILIYGKDGEMRGRFCGEVLENDYFKDV